MVSYSGFNVTHAAIAYFNSITVENFVTIALVHLLSTLIVDEDFTALLGYIYI